MRKIFFLCIFCTFFCEDIIDSLASSVKKVINAFPIGISNIKTISKHPIAGALSIAAVTGYFFYSPKSCPILRSILLAKERYRNFKALSMEEKKNKFRTECLVKHIEKELSETYGERSNDEKAEIMGHITRSLIEIQFSEIKEMIYPKEIKTIEELLGKRDDQIKTELHEEQNRCALINILKKIDNEARMPLSRTVVKQALFFSGASVLILLEFIALYHVYHIIKWFVN